MTRLRLEARKIKAPASSRLGTYELSLRPMTMFLTFLIHKKRHWLDEATDAAKLGGNIDCTGVLVIGLKKLLDNGESNP